MNTQWLSDIGPAFFSLFLCAGLVQAGEIEAIRLPSPQIQGGKPLMLALKERHTSREFSREKLPPQLLSNLLWAAFGVNRPETGGRTAPSAHNWQEISIYVATADGLYLYDALAHSLKTVLTGDVRAKMGLQSFVADAPVNLVYVADFSRMTESSAEDKVLYSAADTGFISENVYLFCSSEGLATVVRGMVDRAALKNLMKLPSDQRVILAQSVGYPAKGRRELP